jgi:hypothetical protein
MMPVSRRAANNSPFGARRLGDVALGHSDVKARVLRSGREDLLSLSRKAVVGSMKEETSVR